MSVNNKEKSIEEYGEEVYVDSVTLLKTSGPKIILNICVAVLIWLFGNMIFIPISQGIFVYEYAVTSIISLITLVTLAGLMVSIVYELRRIANAAAGILAYEVGKRGEVSVEEVSHYRTALTGLLYVSIISIMFLFFSTNLSLIHPALTGIALIAVVIWAFFTLWRVGRALSAEISRYVEDLGKKMEKR